MNLFDQLKYRIDLIVDDIPKEASAVLKIQAFQNFYYSDKFTDKFKLKVIRYIGLMYDHHSPFTIEYVDLGKRKKAVAEDCGFPKSGAGFKAEYEEVMDLDSDVAKILILAFLKDIHYQVWTEIQTTEQELWELTQLRWEKISTTKTKVTKGKATAKEDAGSRVFETDISDKDIYEATNKKEKLMDAGRKRREYLKELYEEMYADNLDIKAVEREFPVTPETAMTYFA